MRRAVPLLLVVFLLAGCGSPAGTGQAPTPSPTPANTPSELPSPNSTPTPTPTPSPSATPTVVPSPTVPAGFVCGGVSGGSVSMSGVSAVRVGQHPGYDRFVIEFSGGIPAYSVTPQTTATFGTSPKGGQVTLQGTRGVLIHVHIIDNWASYGGPTAFNPGYPYLRQALMVENYEGYQQWALGIQGTACVRVATLSSPSRLVVDVVGI